MKDFEIRRILRESALFEYLNDADSKVVEEFDLPVAGARIDVAVFNGALHGYEIKSASDTLLRLPNQIIAYSYIFDYLTIVTEDKHYGKVKAIIPEWVSIAICSNNREYKFFVKHEGRQNPNKNGFYIAQLLWRSELIELLMEQGLCFKKKLRNWALCEIAALNIEPNKLSQLVKDKIKKRDNWRT
ncbi:MAG: sce7726 family protein [Bacteroidia bacterium]|nr:sce7726 family protein [Bacteroidia bacterium]